MQVTMLCVCVCSDFTDSREETVLGSIPLPSYVISPVEPEDHINRKYAFKVTLKWHWVRSLKEVFMSMCGFQNFIWDYLLLRCYLLTSLPLTLLTATQKGCLCAAWCPDLIFISHFHISICLLLFIELLFWLGMTLLYFSIYQNVSLQQSIKNSQIIQLWKEV